MEFVILFIIALIVGWIKGGKEHEAIRTGRKKGVKPDKKGPYFYIDIGD